MTKRRVVVTGVGAVTPLGLTAEDSWRKILAGESGVETITKFDTSAFSTRFGAEVKGFDAKNYFPPKDIKKMDPFIHYGIVASMEAIKDAGLEINDSNAERVGAAIGAGIGGISSIENTVTAYNNGGPRKISPFYVPQSIINMVAGNLSIQYGFKGPNIAVVTACTTGTHNIGLAMRAIQYGDADVMIAGGSEYATTPTTLAGFSAARALSSRNDEPQKASRPWDKDRDGFVLGDGAGILVLEEMEKAKERGATIYAELVGFGMSSDAHHMTQPAQNGEGAARCMQQALKDAQLNFDQVNYINAHGTSTPAGDVAEATAVKTVFGDHAYQLGVSSTKSMTGHLLGAAGGVEAVFSILAMRDKVMPPTINLDNPDEGCDLNFVPHSAQEGEVDVTLSNSFGFGGTNGTLVFKRMS